MEGIRRRSSLLLLVVVVVVVASSSVEAGVGGGKAKEDLDFDGDFLLKNQPSSSSSDDFDGGFPSLDSMLHWSIGHSDPVKLKETAQIVQHLSSTDLEKRHLELKELMEISRMPSDAQLMQIALTDLNNSSLSIQDHYRALHELLVLVELIDNANDLDKLGGLAVVIRELSNSDPDIRTTAAWILGKASQNNPVVQNQVLHLGALAKLMKMANSSSTEEGIKAVYAVSALIRNNLDGQEMFFAAGGDSMLQDAISNFGMDIRLRRKYVSLVADLAEYRIEITNKAEPSLFSNRHFLKSVVDLATSPDLDLQEKALMAIKSLLKLKTTRALDFKDFCDLNGMIKTAREKLGQRIVDLDGDFAEDVENLCREVELLFQRKLEEVQLI